VLLNGWKEIAAYLSCGVRTVQRWEQSDLPVMKVEQRVMARSEDLDSWIRSRIDIKYSHPLRPDLEATLQRVASIRKAMLNNREATIDNCQALLKNELAAGMALADLALRSGDPKVLSRRTALARQAYDTIIRLTQRMTAPVIQTKGFAAELDQLRAALRKLGEKL
jgi:hypothetical protein